MKNKLYEEFHKERSKGLIPVPNTRDFSYRTILPYLDKLLQRGQKVLDIGCGNGALSFFAASRGCKVLGVDVSERAISGCKFNAQRFGFGNDLRFEVEDFDNPREKITEKFDLVICCEVIEHLRDDLRVLRYIYRMLKPGGILFLSTPSINSVIHNIRMLISKKDCFDEEVGHLQRYELRQLILLLRKLDYKILETYKTEGVLRNFFYVTKLGTKLQRFLKPVIRDIVSYLDSSLLFLGESDLIIVATKSI